MPVHNKPLIYIPYTPPIYYSSCKSCNLGCFSIIIAVITAIVSAVFTGIYTAAYIREKDEHQKKILPIVFSAVTSFLSLITIISIQCYLRKKKTFQIEETYCPMDLDFNSLEREILIQERGILIQERGIFNKNSDYDSNQKNNTPLWKIVQPGLNLVGECKNIQCDAYEKRIRIPKGIGSFNINKECKISHCPSCEKTAANVNNLGFFRCYFSINGSYRNENNNPVEVKRERKRAPDNKLLCYEGENTQKWLYLEIKTEPVENDTNDGEKMQLLNPLKESTDEEGCTAGCC